MSPVCPGVKEDEPETALGYCENDAPHWRYRWFRQCGGFAGSGVVEASCKAIIGLACQTGMHWTVPGEEAIRTLR